MHRPNRRADIGSARSAGSFVPFLSSDTSRRTLQLARPARLLLAQAASLSSSSFFLPPTLHGGKAPIAGRPPVRTGSCSDTTRHPQALLPSFGRGAKASTQTTSLNSDAQTSEIGASASPRQVRRWMEGAIPKIGGIGGTRQWPVGWRRTLARPWRHAVGRGPCRPRGSWRKSVCPLDLGGLEAQTPELAPAPLRRKTRR